MLDLVIDSEKAGFIDTTGEGSTATVGIPIEDIIIKTFISFLVLLIILFTPLIIIMISDTAFFEERAFFGGESFNNYINKFSLNKQEVEEEIKTCSMYSLREEGLYIHLLNTMADNLSKKHSLDIDFNNLKKVFSFNQFKLQNNTTIDKLSKELYSQHKELIKKEKEIRDRNNGWIDEIIKLNYNKYSNEIVNKVRNKLNSQDCDKNTFINNFNKQYRVVEIDNKMAELFPELNSRELKEILYNVKKTQEHSDYINGITDAFTPSHERIEASPYYTRENIGDISSKNSGNIWFWLWIYGINSNRIYRDKQTKDAARRSQAKRNNTSHNSKPFGSSFGGGSSSGGGFSGRF